MNVCRLIIKMLIRGVLITMGEKSLTFLYKFSSIAQSCPTIATPWIAARRVSQSITTPGVYSNSCPSSWWCHPALSSSVVPFSSCPQSLPASGSFPMSQLFIWGGQSTGVSTSASVLTMNIQGYFPLGLTDLISQSKALSRVCPTPQFKSINSSALSFLHSPTLTSIHDHWKNHSLD